MIVGVGNNDCRRRRATGAARGRIAVLEGPGPSPPPRIGALAGRRALRAATATSAGAPVATRSDAGHTRCGLRQRTTCPPASRPPSGVTGLPRMAPPMSGSCESSSAISAAERLVWLIPRLADGGQRCRSAVSLASSRGCEQRVDDRAENRRGRFRRAAGDGAANCFNGGAML